MINTQPYVVAIDGPAASGKSTAARILSKRLGIIYVNSGMMYRAITYKCLKSNISPNDEKKVKAVCQATNFEFKQDCFLVNGEDFTTKVSLPEVESLVSEYAKLPGVRKLMTLKQRKLAEKFSIIMDGRDIGSTVFPEAKFKFYLDASITSRAQRRYKELKQKFPDKTFNQAQIADEISKRDQTDQQRSISPLIKASDAIYIDTSNLTIAETAAALYNTIHHE